MKYWLMQTTPLQRIRVLDFLLLLTIVLIGSSVAQAKDLDKVIPDLYGGNGFQTDLQFCRKPVQRFRQ